MAKEDVKSVTVHMENLNEHPQCAHGDYLFVNDLSCLRRQRYSGSV